MIHIFFFTLLFFSLLFPSSSGASVISDDAELARILEAAAANSPIISAARERISQAREDVRAASAGMGPTLTGGVSAAWSGPGNNDAARNVYGASLNLAQTIYSGGSLLANKHAADLALLAVRAESERVCQDAMNSVRESYYECKRAIAQLGVAIEGLNLSKEHLKQTESLHNAGMVPRGDVLRVQISVSQGELDRVSAENEVEVRWIALERAAGEALPRDEILRPVSEEGIGELRPPAFDIPDDAAGAAVANRAEIREYEFYRARAEELVKGAAGQGKPNVSLSAGLGATDDIFWPREDEWRVQLEMRWVLFDGGENASRVSKAKAAARELLNRLEDLTAQVCQEALQAEVTLRSAMIRLGIAEGGVSTAEEDYRLTLKRYNAQMGTNLDVLDARVALTESRTAYVNAVYDIAAAQARLVYALGTDSVQDMK